MEFIINNWASLLIIIITLIILVLLYKYNRRDLVRKIILSFVVQAEKALGSGTGELKYAYVIDKFYSNLPGIIKLLYTPKEVDTYIAEGVSKLKKILSDGVSLSSYDDEIYLDVINKDTLD